ncbi:hypothetical protein EAE99_011238 [Botrytis elliptica]|nr:hypothetical protein EAE99_011238 [Botrytis elliptica]
MVGQKRSSQAFRRSPTDWILKRSSSTNDAQNLRGNRCQKVKSSRSPVTDTKFRQQLSIDVPRSSKAYDSDDTLEKTSRSSRKTCVQCESAEVPIVPEHRQDATKSKEHDEKRRMARVDGDIQDWGREFSSRMISGLSVQNHKWHSSRPSNEYIDVLDAHDNLKGGRSPGIER